jgi:type II secretory pathway pseudopilin PulG/GTPase SAR1 family protein
VGASGLLQAASSALTLLLPEQDELRNDLKLATCHREYPRVRVAIYGPFNQGKSTLINALLGGQVLPADLVPTTGLPIVTGPGPVPAARVTLADGRRVEGDLGVLQRFAVLNSDRRTPEGVISIEVEWPSPFLAAGVLVIDLPGTDDRPDRDEAVRHQLLAADVIIQVLDARKLFTLGERAHVQEWLVERGITSFLFVVNFLNLIDPMDRSKVMERARAVATRFPHSGLFCVDALPALRARLRGDTEGIQSSGLAAFQNAIEQQIAQIAADRESHRKPRLQAVTERIRAVLRRERERTRVRLSQLEQQRRKEEAALHKSLQGLQRSFEARLTEGQSWLTPQRLTTSFRESLSEALRQGKLRNWHKTVFSPQVNVWREPLNQVLGEARRLTAKNGSLSLELTFPSAPSVSLPEKPEEEEEQESIGGRILAGAVTGAAGTSFLGIGALLGALGGAVVGGLSGISSQSEREELKRQREAEYRRQVDRAWRKAATEYLDQFRSMATKQLTAFAKKVRSSFEPVVIERGHEETGAARRLSDLEQALATLETL